MTDEKQHCGPISVCNDKAVAIPRQPDAGGFYLHCAGGFRAAMADKDVWMIEPLLDDGRPCRKGFFTRLELDAFMRSARLTPIAFQNFGWAKGNYHSSWSPLIPGRGNHLQGPSDLWSHIAANLLRQRSGNGLREMKNPSREKIAEILDGRSEEEWLARSISHSLRSMDISVEQITEFYHEQLVDLMADGLVDGRRSARAQDQTLFAHVHSFFLHLGAARDYLAALIAVRIGRDPNKVDSMARLIETVREKDIQTDTLLMLIERRRFIQPASKNANKREISGWLKEASDLRNCFIHRRPYGARHAERFGHVAAIAQVFIATYVRCWWRAMSNKTFWMSLSLTINRRPRYFRKQQKYRGAISRPLRLLTKT
jgi:hypothetical protein